MLIIDKNIKEKFFLEVEYEKVFNPREWKVL